MHWHAPGSETSRHEAAMQDTDHHDVSLDKNFADLDVFLARWSDDDDTGPYLSRSGTMLTRVTSSIKFYKNLE